MVIKEIQTSAPPEAVAALVAREAGTVLLRTTAFDSPRARYSFLAARPMAVFESKGSECWLRHGNSVKPMFGNPWRVIDQVLARYELGDEPDLPFPLGGCFGYWGYDLRSFSEPNLPQNAVADLGLADCCAGFYDSLLAFDHSLGKVFVISTGLLADGSRLSGHANTRAAWWEKLIHRAESMPPQPTTPSAPTGPIRSSMDRESFLRGVEKARRYIQAGDIYQVNLSQRLTARSPRKPWPFYLDLAAASPAPFSAFQNWGTHQLASSSPEMFLRLSGNHITTRPIKGTRPRSQDPSEDARLSYELQTSPKEMAELVMITDLLRNDLGRVCEYGSITVPDLARLERFAQVQHLVSTVEGRLRDGVTHFEALSTCFPGGSITGAPKIRAMQIIDEIEPVARGVYTGCMGYLGFNRESQLSIAIRTAVHHSGQYHFGAGAGIVADSVPEMEYDETLAKAAGFLLALKLAPSEKFLKSANPL